MIHTEAGAYQFRVKYSSEDKSVFVDYFEAICRDHTAVLATYERLRTLHRDRAVGEITVTHKAIRGLYGNGNY